MVHTKDFAGSGCAVHCPGPGGNGGGKVWKSGTTIMNFFIEPQLTVAHDGDGYPKFQVFMGLNMTLGK